MTKIEIAIVVFLMMMVLAMAAFWVMAGSVVVHFISKWW
jgi:hypothetical protein